MTEYYLIAHKVRGEPAFDIAVKMEVEINDSIEEWWLIPTSGHRAYPYWSVPLSEWLFDLVGDYTLPSMPPDWPDHYSVSAAPKGQGQITASQLGKLLNLGRYAKPEGPPLRRPT